MTEQIEKYLEDNKSGVASVLKNQNVYVFNPRELISEIEQLLLHYVSQQRELLGCEHIVITITGRDEGKCADCGIEMIRTWQPNCG